ncbi:MAG: hypothetical protein ABI581_17020 [Sediminibacterium sp.]
MKFSIFVSKHWDALIASIAASAFIYFYTRHSGIGISPDSVNYESAATNIRDHFSFTDFNGAPLVDFPLGYPSFLALICRITGITVLQLAPILNCVLFSGVIILTSIIIDGYQKTSHIYKACILALLACSPCLLEIYSMLWSETFFLFLILLFIALFRNYFRTQRIFHLILVALVVAVAFVTRYAGVTLLGVGFFLLLCNSELVTAKKIRHLFVFIVIGSSLVFINLVRNNNAAGHITGVREKAIRSLQDNLQQAGITVSDWLPFLHGHEGIAKTIFLLLLVYAVCLLIYSLLQQQFFASYPTIVTCFFVVYTLFIVTIASISRFEELTSRLLSPLYIPMLLIGSGWIVPVMQRSFRTKKIITGFLVLIVYAGFHYAHYRLNAEAWEGIKDAGIPGYSEDSWTQSPAVALVKKNKPLIKQPVYANANDAVFFLTGIHSMALPHKEIQQEVDAFLRHSSFSLIWFIDGDNPDLVNLDFIKKHKKLISQEEVEGGAIYHFAD